MTKVLFISRSLQSEPGGMQTATRVLLDALRARPDVELSVLGWGGRKIGLPFFFLRAFIRARSFRGDAVHFGDAAFSVIVPRLRRARPDLRLTCTVHGLDLVFPSARYQASLRRALPLFDAVAAVSAATAEAAVERGAPRGRLTVIPWGVPPAALAGREPGPPTLFSIGRQIPRKGTAWFIEYVLPLLLTRHPDLRYVVAGEGKELPRLRSLAASMGLGHAVRLLGVISEEEKERWYGRADLFVMPNVPVAGDMEGFGMTCIEAAARGLPTVAARLEGVTDAVQDGATGLLFPAGDAHAAAAAVELALARQWGRASVQASCRARHDIATVASRYATELFAPAGHRHADGR